MNSRIRPFQIILLVAIFAGSYLIAPTSSLAIGTDGCPGRLMVIPAPPDSFLDAGNTDNMSVNCQACSNGDPGGAARDVFYYFDLTHPTYLLISTCGSAYDTYICIFKDTCCTGTRQPLISNDNDTLRCPTHPNRATISTCFLNSGRYYLVVTGGNAGAVGSYQVYVKEVSGQRCGPTPPVLCTPGYGQHVETLDEAVCEHAFTTMESCPQGYCGSIDRRGDRDVYAFTLSQCKTVTLSAYGNDTPGRSSTGGTLNPQLRLFAGPACDHPLYTNYDVNTTGPGPQPPIGKDSRIVTDCLRPGTYWVEISGDTTVGKYEFTYECALCTRTTNSLQVNVQSPSSGRYCVSWAAQPGANIYYVWRYDLGTWTLAGTTRTTEFCETFSDNGGQPTYEVFTDPCGIPQTPDR